MCGKERRLRRIFDAESGRTIIIPLDHGMTMGPIPGIDNMELLFKMLQDPGPNAVILHKGLLKRYVHLLPAETAIFMHLSASIGFSPNRDEKVLVATVEEAVRLGADGVSIHINLGCSSDRKMLSDAGKVSEACMHWGMPLLMMVYAHPDSESVYTNYGERLGHCIRICEELGADLVKVPVPVCETESFSRVISASGIPVLAAGGEAYESIAEYMAQVKRLMRGSTAGICAGRNIFQHIYPGMVLEELQQIVHGLKLT